MEQAMNADFTQIILIMWAMALALWTIALALSTTRLAKHKNRFYNEQLYWQTKANNRWHERL